MSETKAKHTTFNQYFGDFPDSVQAILQQIRETIAQEIPTATEAITYGIPTFKVRGKNLVHFGAYKNHIGFYPTPSGMESFAEQLAPYSSGKGSAQFPLDQPMPLELIREIVRFRLTQIPERAGKGKKSDASVSAG